METMTQNLSLSSSVALTGAASDVFDLDSFEDVGTGEYVVKHPETGAPTPLVLILAGPEHPSRKKKRFNRIRKARAAAAKTGKIQFDDPADEEEATPLDVAECIVGWRGMVRSGHQVPYSFEEALRIMRDPKKRWLLNQARVALDETELFIKTCANS
jgi:hypothetical protein